MFIASEVKSDTMARSRLSLTFNTLLSKTMHHLILEGKKIYVIYICVLWWIVMMHNNVD